VAGFSHRGLKVRVRVVGLAEVSLDDVSLSDALDTLEKAEEKALKEAAKVFAEAEEALGPRFRAETSRRFAWGKGNLRLVVRFARPGEPELYVVTWERGKPEAHLLNVPPDRVFEAAKALADIVEEFGEVTHVAVYHSGLVLEDRAGKRALEISFEDGKPVVAEKTPKKEQPFALLLEAMRKLKTKGWNLVRATVSWKDEWGEVKLKKGETTVYLSTLWSPVRLSVQAEWSRKTGFLPPSGRLAVMFPPLGTVAAREQGPVTTAIRECRSAEEVVEFVEDVSRLADQANDYFPWLLEQGFRAYGPYFAKEVKGPGGSVMVFFDPGGLAFYVAKPGSLEVFGPISTWSELTKMAREAAEAAEKALEEMAQVPSREVEA